VRRWLRRRRALRQLYPDGQMPYRFKALAEYHREVAHGVVHTVQWDARMAELQREYDEWSRRVQQVHGLWRSPVDRLLHGKGPTS
jgi:hypothetical protein